MARSSCRSCRLSVGCVVTSVRAAAEDHRIRHADERANLCGSSKPIHARRYKRYSFVRLYQAKVPL